MASTRTEFSEKLFEIQRKSEDVPQMEVKLSLGYIGTSSLNSTASLCCRKTGLTYARNINQVVVVDKATRKPTRIPEWWREMYSEMAVTGQSLVVPLIDVMYDHAHKYDVKVAWSDTDQYKHTNYLSYIRFCQDAAMDACHVNHFSAIKGDFLKYNTRNISICYKNETVANDRLVVYVWENESDNMQLHFSIVKDEAIIFQATFSLYDNPVV